LDSRLDRELGIDSLGMVELVERLDRLFGVELPTAVMATAETPRDLLQAVRRAPVRGNEPPRVPSPRPTTTFRAADHPASHAPSHAPSHTSEHPATGEVATLVEAIDWHVSAHPDRCHVRLLGDAYTRQDPPATPVGGHGIAPALDMPYGEMSYGELGARARNVAGALAGYGVVAGDRVALMLPTSDEYFAVFAGILVAGAVPVPIYPPGRPSQLEEHLRRQVGILANAEVRVFVTVPEARQVARLVRAQVASLKKVAIARELLVPPGPGHDRDPSTVGKDPGADDIALLQYTSGSTDNPKGVVLTHANLIANIEAMGAAAKIGSSDVFVSWLPLYHDMGLIGAWLSSLYYGMGLAVMTPQAFLAKPARWLWAIHRHGGTVSAAPNFAYDLCTRRIDDAELEGLDLSSWHIAMNGAEPVSPRTLARFADRFAPYGLSAGAMTPVYGLAEAALGLVFPPIGRGVLVDRVDQEEFVKSGRASPARDATKAALDHASCGMPLPGYEIRIVDSAGAQLPERREGCIEFRGPSTTVGYFHNPASTRQLHDGDWLDTGDLGYLAGGELFVTGRTKDLVIRAGQNLHPEGLEEAIGGLDDVRKGCVAAFGVPDPSTGTERLVVVAESRATDPAALAVLRAGIVRVAVDQLGAPPDEIVVAAPGTVRKTSSGKIRRAATRELYLRDRLQPERRSMAWQLVRFAWQGVGPGMRRTAGAVPSLAFATYAWTVFVLVGLPALLAAVIVPGQRRRRAVAYRSARALVRLTGTPLTVAGAANLSIPGPYVVVANHASYLDSFVLAAVVPDRLSFLAGEVFATKALIGFVLGRLGVQFVERGTRSNAKSEIAQVTEVLRHGTPLAFFPEGGLSRSPGLRRFHQGAFVAAAGAGCPVVPIGIRGTRTMVRPGARFVRRGEVHLVVGEPLYPSGSDWHAALDLSQRARQAIAPHCGEPDLA
jgi:1-acyl-sn-glycerol-3-phosphate acyltransferase